MTGLFALAAILLLAFLAALLVAPLFDGKGKAPEVRLTRGIAVAYVVVASAATVYRVVEVAVAPNLDVSMPVEEFWPTMPPGSLLDGTTAQVVSGGFSQAYVQVQGLAASTRWLLGATALLQGIVAVVIGAAVLSMCNGYLKKTTFRPVLVKWFTVTAVVVLVCGLGWQIVEQIAGLQASSQVLGNSGSEWLNTDPPREDLHEIVGVPEAVYFAFTVNFWPVFAGLGLYATAQIFKRGQIMQKDLAGLV